MLYFIEVFNSPKYRPMYSMFCLVSYRYCRVTVCRKPVLWLNPIKQGFCSSQNYSIHLNPAGILVTFRGWTVAIFFFSHHSDMPVSCHSPYYSRYITKAHKVVPSVSFNLVISGKHKQMPLSPFSFYAYVEQLLHKQCNVNTHGHFLG